MRADLTVECPQSFTPTRAEFLQHAINICLSTLEEEFEQLTPRNEEFLELSEFLLMEASDGHVEVLHQALDYRYASLMAEIKLESDASPELVADIDKSKELLDFVEDLRSRLPNTVETTVPSTAGMMEKYRGGNQNA